MEGNGIDVNIIGKNRFGDEEVWEGKVVSFTANGNAVVVFTEGPRKSMFEIVPINNIRAILGDGASD